MMIINKKTVLAILLLFSFICAQDEPMDELAAINDKNGYTNVEDSPHELKTSPGLRQWRTNNFRVQLM
jgi:hypothetical protein